MKNFAKYYTFAMIFGFSMFFVFDYLKKQEIFAVLIGAMLFAVPYTLLTRKKNKKK